MRKTDGRQASALVLFDIDGTLLRRAGPHHREALVEAVRKVAGIEAPIGHIPVQGMLDQDILTVMLRDASVPDRLIRKWMPLLVRRAQWIYARRCPEDLTEKVCPGVGPFLESMRRAGALAGLVSGNLTRIGWKKMERAGLKRYFRFGSFAERGPTRGHLVKLAIREARAKGWVARTAPVALVGDHPNDIRAARENGVIAVAVATGIATREELAAHGPDFLLDDLRQATLSGLLW
ncbi:MAG: haloacid dehalogenase-like hydrolase [Bryobacterales bacterium]|nr:haloacid dehalogenase-like hydrolase [Bryobacterales bacterium]